MQKIPDNRVRSCGDEYLKAASLCIDQKLLWPAAINAALACEIYLKSFLSSVEIISSNNMPDIAFPKSQTGHNLEVLFKKIDPNIQQLIQDESKNIDASFDILEKISKYKNFFTDGRYYYESKAHQSIDSGIVDLAVHISAITNNVILHR